MYNICLGMLDLEIAFVITWNFYFYIFRPPMLVGARITFNIFGIGLSQAYYRSNK